MITGLTAADEPAAFRAEAVFDTARSLGVEYVVISLGWWNDGFGHYTIQKVHFPQGVASLKQVADRAHALGLKLGIHVMSASIGKEDAYVTPTPDRRLQKEGETTLAADVDAAAATIPTAGAAGQLWHGPGLLGLWRHRRADRRRNHLLSQPSQGSSFGAAGLRPGATALARRRTRPGPKWSTSPSATVGTWPIRSWPAKSAAIWPSLINQAGLDMVCFDGADVPDVADPSLPVLFRPSGGGRHPAACAARRARDQQRQHAFRLAPDGARRRGRCPGAGLPAVRRRLYGASVGPLPAPSNLFVPDFSWVGIFGHTPVLPAPRPDDVELVCTRSLGFDGPVGWAFAACAGGPSSVETFRDNGRKAEIAAVIRTYEKLRLEHYFPAEARRPLRALGSHWRLLPPKTPADRYRLVPAAYRGQRDHPAGRRGNDGLAERQ